MTNADPMSAPTPDPRNDAPDYWRPWARRTHRTVLRLMCYGLLPAFLIAGALIGLRDGFRSWRDDLKEVSR